jgi:hypothetical protein
MVTPGILPAAVPEPWNGIISKAATKHHTSGPLLAAILYWENRAFPDKDKVWATSSAGAQGPMQFIPSTWEAYKEDGDGDGKADVLNNFDAVFGAAKLLSANGVTADAELGTLQHPGTPGTLLRAAANYNWGGGNVESNGGADITLDDMPQETSDYLRAVYVLIISNFSSLPMSGDISSDTKPSDTSASTTGISSDSCGGESTTVGTGAGKFTDNSGIQITGAVAAVAKAKRLAAAGPSVWSEICAGATDSVNCHAACERLASVVWGRTNSGYGSALGHWQAKVGSSAAHPGDRNPPIGALLFYNNAGDFGHVATYLGSNMVLSNDVNDSKSGHEGGVYIVPASDMETTGWHLTYLGWVNPVPW